VTRFSPTTKARVRVRVRVRARVCATLSFSHCKRALLRALTQSLIDCVISNPPEVVKTGAIPLSAANCDLERESTVMVSVTTTGTETVLRAVAIVEVYSGPLPP